MANYISFLDSNNVVTQVIQSPDDGQDWAAIWSDKYNCKCVVTAADGSIRNKYAKPGDIYYQDVDAFIEPQPYQSWSLNKTAKKWEPPTAKPEDGLPYSWNEEERSWTVVVPVQPFASWVLNEVTYGWESPTPYPSDGNTYEWDENTLSWVQATD